MSPLHTHVNFELPDWLDGFVQAWDTPLDTDERRMKLAIALSAENISHDHGGPFGAIVVEEESNRLLGVGVNLVTVLDLSIAHAEMVAMSMAQAKIGNWNLGSGPAAQLVTSCEPCAMCFGAVPWSGVSSMIWGARKDDAEAAGFDEGDKPQQWVKTLEDRKIRTRGDVLRDEAAAVLSEYARTEGAIYHPERH